MGLLAVSSFPAAANAAPTWSEPVTLGVTGRESGPPRIAVTPTGEALVVWEGGRPNGIQVSSRRPGHGWRRPIRLARSGESAPRIAATRRKAIVVWVTRSRPGAWKPRSSSPQLAYGGNGAGGRTSRRKGGGAPNRKAGIRRLRSPAEARRLRCGRPATKGTRPPPSSGRRLNPWGGGDGRRRSACAVQSRVRNPRSG